MSVESSVYSVLKDGTTGGIVGTKIYPVEASQPQQPPYVVYEVVSSVPVESPFTGKETNETVIDIACYGNDYARSKAIAAAVRDDLISGLDPCVIENTQDLRDPDTRRKYVVLTFRIWTDDDF